MNTKPSKPGISSKGRNWLTDFFSPITDRVVRVTLVPISNHWDQSSLIRRMLRLVAMAVVGNLMYTARPLVLLKSKPSGLWTGMAARLPL